ncbi:MAG: MFS transporter [Pseudomonadales bacterium]
MSSLLARFSLLSRPGAAPFFLAIFLNATIDLGHKITIQNVIFKVHDGAEQVVLTAIVNALILLPYVLFFIPIGQVANRMPKPILMRITAWASVAMLSLLMFCYSEGWFWLAFSVTFLMSVQSAFYSPAKLGYLKTLFGEKLLPAANGLAQSMAIIGILLGTLLFSIGFESIYSDAAAAMAPLSSKDSVLVQMPPLLFALFALVVLQLWAVYRVPVLDERPAAQVPGAVRPAVQKTAAPITAAHTTAASQQAGYSGATARAILSRRYFLFPILGLALFWTAGQAMLAVFPAYAKAVANIDNTAVIQAILTCTGLGIIVGASIVGRLQRSPYNLSLVPAGIFLMIAGLFAVLFLRSAPLFALLYFALGLASGLLVVPLNAFIQARSSQGNIGSVIATSNLFQNIAMLGMVAVTIAMALAGFSPARLLWVLAITATVAGVMLLAPLKAVSEDSSVARL